MLKGFIYFTDGTIEEITRVEHQVVGFEPLRDITSLEDCTFVATSGLYRYRRAYKPYNVITNIPTTPIDTIFEKYDAFRSRYMAIDTVERLSVFNVAPCPFCGEEPRIRLYDGNKFDVVCDNSECALYGASLCASRNLNEVVGKWNNRYCNEEDE